MGFQFLLCASPFLRPPPASPRGAWAWSVCPVLCLGPPRAFQDWPPERRHPLPSQLAWTAEPGLSLAPGTWAPWAGTGPVRGQWWPGGSRPCPPPPSLPPGRRGPCQPAVGPLGLPAHLCSFRGLGASLPFLSGGGCAEGKGGLAPEPPHSRLENGAAEGSAPPGRGWGLTAVVDVECLAPHGPGGGLRDGCHCRY